jgi:hypothetical protein
MPRMFMCCVCVCMFCHIGCMCHRSKIIKMNDTCPMEFCPHCSQDLINAQQFEIEGKSSEDIVVGVFVIFPPYGWHFVGALQSPWRRQPIQAHPEKRINGIHCLPTLHTNDPSRITDWYTQRVMSKCGCITHPHMKYWQRETSKVCVRVCVCVGSPCVLSQGWHWQAPWKCSEQWKDVPIGHCSCLNWRYNWNGKEQRSVLLFWTNPSVNSVLTIWNRTRPTPCILVWQFDWNALEWFHHSCHRGSTRGRWCTLYDGSRKGVCVCFEEVVRLFHVFLYFLIQIADGQRSDVCPYCSGCLQHPDGSKIPTPDNMTSLSMECCMVVHCCKILFPSFYEDDRHGPRKNKSGRLEVWCTVLFVMGG